MFFAYVVRSIDTGYLYKGHCEDLEARLKQHNSGMTRTKDYSQTLYVAHDGRVWRQVSLVEELAEMGKLIEWSKRKVWFSDDPNFPLETMVGDMLNM